MSKNSLKGFLLGFLVVIALGGVWGYMEQSEAQQGGTSYLLQSGNMNGQQYDLIYLIDSDRKRVAVYRYNRGVLEILDVRNIKYDLRLDFLQRQTGRSIQQVRRKVSKQ